MRSLFAYLVNYTHLLRRKEEPVLAWWLMILPLRSQQ